jgi:hypothetical protein
MSGVRRIGVVVLALLSGAAAEAHAQAAGAPSARRAGFLTRFNFHLDAASLRSGEAQFSWDADFGGDADLVDYGAGRLNVLANYEVVLGEEFRAFDPNQANYVLEVLGSVRAGRTEVAGVFHHTSRHLSDRPKVFPIDWNMMGIQVTHLATAGGRRLDSRARLLGVVGRSSFIDYRWRLEGGVAGRLPLHARLAVIAGADVTYLAVDRTVADRGAQKGAHLEGGVRIQGGEAALELFVAVERRIDAHPIERVPRTWLLAGFRLLRD